MKKITFILSLLVAAFLSLGVSQVEAGQARLDGSWTYQDGRITHSVVFVDGYFSHTMYDLAGQQFLATRGGTYEAAQNQFTVNWQYDTEKTAAEIDPATWLGSEDTFTAVLSGSGLQTDIAGSSALWQRVAEQPTPLTGVWRMSGRKQGDEISESPLRARRTLKILSGSRFQWVAINIETGAFSGTGGGTYTYENGTYTEHIEFFSRDGSRVGASLEFEGTVVDGAWHHSGLSSAGNPIYEIWTKLEE